MNFVEYEELARKTAIYPHVGKNYLYPVLEVSGEAGELAEKLVVYLEEESDKEALIYEIGDLLWGMTNLALELNANLNTVCMHEQDFASYQMQVYLALKPEAEPQNIMLQLLGRVGKISDVAKKIMRDNGGILGASKRYHILAYLTQAVLNLVKLCVVLDISLDDAATKNIAKLQSRQERGTIHGDGDDR